MFRFIAHNTQSTHPIRRDLLRRRSQRCLTVLTRRIESLEDRCLLAVGDFLYAVGNPGVQPQAGGEYGFDSAMDGATAIIGAPAVDAAGYPNVGAAYLVDLTLGDVLHEFINPTPSPGDRFGESVAINDRFVVVGDSMDDSGETDAGSVYVFDRVTGELLHHIANPEPAPFDFFGYAIAVEGMTLVVGAYLDDTNGPDTGTAYVYDIATGELQQTLNRPDGAMFDYFGYAVDISGGRVVVGAHRADVGAVDDGEALVFDLDGTLQYRFQNPTPENFEYFGHDVAISGSLLVAGAYREDAGAVNAGAAYVLDLSSETLLHTISNPVPEVSSNFGYSLDLSGFHLVVGAYRADAGARDAGAAYHFDASSGELLATWKNPTPATLDYFGASVAVSPVYALVGSYWDDVASQDAGSVVQFNLANNATIRTLLPPAISSYDYFGQALAVSDEVLVVGAYLDDTGGTDAGAVRVFDVRSGELLLTIANPAPANFDRFGSSVSLDGNVLVVGASGDTAGDVLRAGAAYVFDLATGNLLHTLTSPAPSSHDQFGTSVSISGGNIAVGAYGVDRDELLDVGAVYVFDATSGIHLQTLANPVGNEFDQFGNAVSVSAGLVAVGAQSDDSEAIDAGRAYIFDLPTGELLTLLLNPAPEEGDYFGQSLSLRGNLVLVGAPRKDGGASNAGSAFLMDAVTGEAIAAIRNPVPEPESYFGHDVAISSDFAVIGAYAASDGSPMSGAAYAFAVPTGLFHAELADAAHRSFDFFGYAVAASESYLAVGAPLVDGLGTDRGAAFVFDGGIVPDAVPVADPGGPYVVGEGSTLTLDGSNSHDVYEPLASLLFEWDLDYDGVNFDVDLTGTNPSIELADEIMDALVALRVTDQAGQSSIATTTLTVENVAPIFARKETIQEVIMADIGEQVSIAGTLKDADGDLLQLQASVGEIVDQGDGTWTWSWQVEAADDPVVVVTLTATDGDGGLSTIVVIVNTADLQDPPEITPLPEGTPEGPTPDERPTASSGEDELGEDDPGPNEIPLDVPLVFNGGVQATTPKSNGPDASHAPSRNSFFSSAVRQARRVRA